MIRINKTTPFKNFILCFLSSIVVVFSASGQNNTGIDSLEQSVNESRQIPGKEKLMELINRSLTEDKQKLNRYLSLYIHLPDSVATNREKSEFLKKTASRLALTDDYKNSYSLLRRADSLLYTETSKTATETLPAGKSKETSGTAFIFFIISSLLASVSLVYFLYVRKKEKEQLHKLQEKHTALESELEKKKKALEEEIDEKTADLQKQLDELKDKEAYLKSELKKAEEANYLKNAFLANMGFDIRTPLNSIIGFANLLETELAVRKNKELYNYAYNIEKSGYYLLKMLNNIIDLSGLEANTLELKISPVTIEDIINEIGAEYALAAREKGLVFKTKSDEDLPPVLADKEGLKKVLDQIVDNAIQYTDEGFVTVSCTYDEDHQLVVIEVRDTGIGMSKKLQNSVLRPFIEISEETGQSSGAGIGLKLAKKYVEMMKGQLLIASEPDEGTTVTVQLPCSEQSEVVITRDVHEVPGETVEEVTTTLHELGKLDFFVVEDDRMNRLIIEKILSKEGTVTMAVDGDDCMKIVDREAEKGHYFQVMLFDINLPEPWDGVKLMKEIRKKYPAYRKIPFIAQTAYAMAGDKEYFLKEGFDSYVAKPIDKNELIAVVRRQLEFFGSQQKN